MDKEKKSVLIDLDPRVSKPWFERIRQPSDQVEGDSCHCVLRWKNSDTHVRIYEATSMHMMSRFPELKNTPMASASSFESDTWIIKIQDLDFDENRIGIRAQMIASSMNPAGLGYIDNVCPVWAVWPTSGKWTKRALAFAMPMVTRSIGTVSFFDCNEYGEVSRFFRDISHVRRDMWGTWTLHAFVMHHMPKTMVRSYDSPDKVRSRLDLRTRLYQQLSRIVMQVLLVLRAHQSSTIRMIHGDFNLNNVLLTEDRKSSSSSSSVKHDAYRYRVVNSKGDTDTYTLPMTDTPVVTICDYSCAMSDAIDDLFDPASDGYMRGNWDSDATIRRWQDQVVFASALRTHMALCCASVRDAMVHQPTDSAITELDRLLHDMSGGYFLTLFTHYYVTHISTVPKLHYAVAGSSFVPDKKSSPTQLADLTPELVLETSRSTVVQACKNITSSSASSSVLDLNPMPRWDAVK